MKKLLGGMALCALLAAPAFAADLPARVPSRMPAAPVAVASYYNWTACFIGVNGGFGSGRTTGSAFGISSTLTGVSGGLAGGQIGCDYQSGMFVFGVEVDGQWADLSRTDTLLGVPATSKINWFMTARGRLGVAMNNVLFYGTGGYAQLGIKNEIPLAAFSESTSRGGWTAGGGVEVAFWDNWSVRGEYLYVRTFDRTSAITIPPPFGPGAGSLTTRTDAHIGRIALNWRWGGGTVVARY